jgi:O-antigen/teichoic acid export membrane protein
MSRAYGKKDFNQTKGLLVAYFKTQFFLAFFATVLVFFGANIIASFYQGQITSLLKIAAFTFLISALRTTYTVIFSVYLRFFVQSLHTFIEELSKLLFVIVFVVWLQAGAVGLMYATVASQIAALLVLSPFFWNTYKDLRTVKPDKVSIVTLIRAHGKWSLFSGCLNDFNQSVRLWIIKSFLGTEAVGLFAVAQGLLSHTTALLPLSQVISPIIPQHIHDNDRFNKLVGKSIKYQWIAFSCIGIFAFFFFPPILSIIFPSYKPSMFLFRILLLSLIGSTTASIFTSIYYALKEQKNYFFSIAGRTALTIVLAPPLIYVFGLSGVAWEYVITINLIAIERYFALQRLKPGFNHVTAGFFDFDDYDKMVIGKIKEKFKFKRLSRS